MPHRPLGGRLGYPICRYAGFNSQLHRLRCGLAICRKIISEHDGRITLHNHPEGGALVTVLLPCPA